MTIINLLPRLPAQECKESALAHLRAVIDRVESGETETVGIIEVSTDGATRIHHSKSENINVLLGGISRLAHKLNAYLDSKS